MNCQTLLNKKVEIKRKYFIYDKLFIEIAQYEDGASQ